MELLKPQCQWSGHPKSPKLRTVYSKELYQGYRSDRIATRLCSQELRGQIPDCGCKTFIVTLLTGSDKSVMNTGPERKDYSDHSSYSYSGIGPEIAP